MLASLIENVDCDGAVEVMHDVNWNCIVERIVMVHPFCMLLEMLKDVKAAPTELTN